MNHGIITDKATWGDATRLRWKTWPSKKFPSSFRRETKIECFYLATQRSSHLTIRSKINFLKGKEQSKRSIYRVSRHATRALRACSGQLGCGKKGFSKRCAVRLCASRDAMRAALPRSRMREPPATEGASGGSGEGREGPGEGDMPQQPWKEGWHPESEWGAGCTTLPPPMQPAARPTAEI